MEILLGMKDMLHNHKRKSKVENKINSSYLEWLLLRLFNVNDRVSCLDWTA